MKTLVSSIILLAILIQISYSQFVTELNSCVTTELTSSSNGKATYWYSWQGWACGVNGTVIKSIGTSNNWRNVSGNGIPTNITLDNICGVDSSIAFVAGHLNSNTWVWKTTNGGQNWFQVFAQPNGRINSVWMKNNFQGFMQGNPVNSRWSLWKTTNGGNNWDSTGLYLPRAGVEQGWPNSLCMPMSVFLEPADSNKIWFGTNNSRIYYSSDYGLHWAVQSTSPEQNSFCIAYGKEIQGTKYLFAGGSTYMLRSTNDGSNWSTITIGGSGNIVGVALCWINWFAARENKLYRKPFGSENWNQFYTAPSGTYTYIDNRGYGMWYDHYAVRTTGGITFICEGEGVQKVSSEIPDKFSLSQNYPNPFNPKSNIKFQIAKSGLVKLLVLDILGREVSTLVNEHLNTGIYEVKWDGSNYPSGVYFYKLVTESYSETRKMVLVK